MSAVLEDVVAAVKEAFAARPVTVVLGAGVGVLATLRLVRYLRRDPNAPPFIPSPIPWLGHAKQYDNRPIQFLLDCYRDYGPVFSLTLLGSRVTYLIGSEASSKFWSSHNDDLNAEDLYANLTNPVFGDSVAYAVEHRIFLEQKQISKAGLSDERFNLYVGMIEEEARDYLKDWADSGEIDIFEALAEMIVFTATRCLHGKETRERFDKTVAELYHDLDGGFSQAAWLLPSWLPLPSFRRRDRAHVEIKRRFMEIIEERRKSTQGSTELGTDMLSTFMNAKYERVEGGRKWHDGEISGLLIALLMAGQHTSSTTSAWMSFYVAADPEVQQRLYKEQMAAFDSPDQKLTREILENNMPALHATVRETLRLRPPIMQLMRKCRKPFEIEANGRKYVIPVGDQVVACPPVNHHLEDEWDDPYAFDLDRFLHAGHVTAGEQIKKGGKFKWVPFGAGRHRCIGFLFAQLQIRTIFSVLIREFEFELVDGRFPEINLRTLIHTPDNCNIRFKRRKPTTASL